jgi:hypothetical protein
MFSAPLKRLFEDDEADDADEALSFLLCSLVCRFLLGLAEFAFVSMLENVEMSASLLGSNGDKDLDRIFALNGVVDDEFSLSYVLEWLKLRSELFGVLFLFWDFLFSSFFFSFFFSSLSLLLLVLFGFDFLACEAFLDSLVFFFSLGLSLALAGLDSAEDEFEGSGEPGLSSESSIGDE